MKTMELKETVGMMESADYKERFKAEYYQTKIRYEKLRAFNTRIEAARPYQYCAVPEGAKPKVEMPKHDCTEDLLLNQQHIMGQYLHVLEVRAVVEGIEL